MPDGTFQIVGAAAGLLSLLWNVANALKQNKFKNCENEFKTIEELILEARRAAIRYWMAEQRDQSKETELLILLDDIASKLTSLQAASLIKSAPSLSEDLISFRQAATLHPFQSNDWARDPGRCGEIRRAADNLLHRFLQIRRY